MAEYPMNSSGISIPVASTSQILAAEEEAIEKEYKEKEPEPTYYDPLVAHILSVFSENANARETSGIEDEIIASLEAYNGKYSTKDLTRIESARGSTIFMNITATKARAARSWIADILKPAHGKPWSLEPTPIEDLPSDLRAVLTEAFEKEFEGLLQQGQPQAPQGPQPGTPQMNQSPPQQGPPQQGPPADVEAAQETVRATNERRRSIEKAVREEIHREAKFQLHRMERKIEDQLVEGKFDKALSDFLTDFVVYPTAFMKGPIVTKKTKLMWQDGKPVEVEQYCYLNKRVDPLDMYPSPEAEDIDDGDLCEHMRFSLAEIASLKDVEGYHEEAIERVLMDAEMNTGTEWVDSSIEQDKADLEDRGTFIDMSRNTIHGLHFWGTVQVKTLKEWEFKDKIKGLEKQDDDDVVSVEAILVGQHVIKCEINDDPLKRRPYYKASFMERPGAFWGKSLPSLMSSVQRMCNAVARALSNNLAISSGPQVEIYTDRLADNGDIEEVTPFKIWQLKSDPSGAGGRAINFWQPTSNAQELLAVYEKFEEKADDITGIPKYAYGNEKTAGAAQTAQGLAMLLESTSKIIKDCIRNIDEGLIKRRIMYQFHHNMLNLDDLGYSGDVNVKTIGSDTLTIRGAEATKRNEFLQATANPTDMAVMGIEGRAAILRKMGEDLGLPNVIPTDFEIKQKIKADELKQQQAMAAQGEAEQAKAQVGLQATQMQVQGQMQMHQGTLQKEMAKIQADMQKFQTEMQLKMAELQRKAQRDQLDTQATAARIQSDEKKQTQEVALKLKKGEGI